MDRAETNNKLHYDYLIIGAGPAGLQLGFYLERAGRDYIILEAGDAPGTFFKRFPRHRTLISINKVHTGFEDNELNLRWDWNSLLSDNEEMLFKQYSERFFPAADDLVKYLSDFTAHFRLKVKCGIEVKNIARDESFKVSDSKGNVYSCKYLIVATGLTRLWVPPIPGIELAEKYTDISIDPKDFVGQRVLIIGKGNSGFETADNISETAAVIHLASPHPLKFAWKTHFVGHLRAVNNNILDTYLLKSQNGLLDATIDSITSSHGKLVVDFTYQRAHGARTQIEYDRVILCTGFRFNDEIFDQNCKPAMVIDDRFPAQTSEWESPNIHDLYFAGTLMQVRDFKKTASGFIHGFRYTIRALHRMMELKYHGQPWSSRPIAPTAEAVADAVLERLNSSSALWQLTGFICDLIEIPANAAEAHYYRELPVDYVHNSKFGDLQHYYLVTLEYGPDYPDSPFEFDRFIKADEAHLNPQLHPVIRRFEGSELKAEHHVLEDLEGRWVAEMYTRPLKEFFSNQLS